MSINGFDADIIKESSVSEWNKSMQRVSNTRKTMTKMYNRQIKGEMKMWKVRGNWF